MTKDCSPTISIVIVAGFQIFVSVLLSVFVDGARRIYFSDHFSPSKEFLPLGILLGSGLLGIVAAMGLMRLKNWARHLTKLETQRHAYILFLWLRPAASSLK